MVVEEMNILTTLFLKFDNEIKICYPNAILSTKSIGNYYRSPDQIRETLEFGIDYATSLPKIAKLKERIKKFEPDMLAFSGCDYGGGEKEREELGTIRRQWKTLHKSDPNKQRRLGNCPLTQEEVGLMIRALGYNSDVHIYVASGEVYGREDTLAPLRELFPKFHSKDTLASQDELAPFSSYSPVMAALDFIVCDESDVFVTNKNGNMARILAGRRRYHGTSQAC